TDTDTRRDPAEDGCVVGAATEQRAPVLSASIFNREAGLLRGGLDGLERGDTDRVVDVVEDAHRRGRTGQDGLGAVGVAAVAGGGAVRRDVLFVAGGAGEEDLRVVLRRLRVLRRHGGVDYLLTRNRLQEGLTHVGVLEPLGVE